jgi:hypothetical protein
MNSPRDIIDVYKEIEHLPRDIIDVYKEIDKHIPHEYEELKKELKDFIQNLWNKAPEVRKCGDTYVEFAEILKFYITDYNENWVIIIKDIFNGKIAV